MTLPDVEQKAGVQTLNAGPTHRQPPQAEDATTPSSEFRFASFLPLFSHIQIMLKFLALLCIVLKNDLPSFCC